MTPLFKTDYSIGNSLLKPKKCFDLAKDLNEIVFVEDSFSGFRTIRKLAEKNEKVFRWGVNIKCSHADNKASKVVLFAKNNEGFKDLLKIYSRAKTKGVWKFNSADLKNILLCVPFYNSYIHKGIHNFGVFDLPLNDYIHFIEDNNHPYDYQINKVINSLGVKTQKVQTICYEKKEDFKEFQFYHSTCNRSGGKSPTKDKPELDDCGVDTFSWENYESKEK